jgi:plastocyanin
MVLAALTVAAPASAADANILAFLGAAGGNFTTKSVTIPKGGHVTFQNLDVAVHNVTATKLRKKRPAFRSGDVSFGGKAQVAGVSALKRGAYGYICSIHPRMKGTLHVR